MNDVFGGYRAFSESKILRICLLGKSSNVDGVIGPL